jgi:hypothetical protein
MNTVKGFSEIYFREPLDTLNRSQYINRRRAIVSRKESRSPFSHPALGATEMSLATIDRPGNKPDIAGYKLEEFGHRAGGHVIAPDGQDLGSVWYSDLLGSWQALSLNRVDTPAFKCLESAFDWMIKVDVQAARALSQPF